MEARAELVAGGAAAPDGAAAVVAAPNASDPKVARKAKRQAKGGRLQQRRSVSIALLPYRSTVPYRLSTAADGMIHDTALPGTYAHFIVAR
eukprot:5082333-Prymnesium_polylepis.1